MIAARDPLEHLQLVLAVRTGWTGAEINALTLRRIISTMHKINGK
jgi:hypothetical protein